MAAGQGGQSHLFQEPSDGRAGWNGDGEERIVEGHGSVVRKASGGVPRGQVRGRNGRWPVTTILCSASGRSVSPRTASISRVVLTFVPILAAAMLQYHLIHILLYAESHLRDPSQSLQVGVLTPRIERACQTDSSQVQYHATQIICIAISDIPDAVRVFSPQTLFYGE